MSVTGWGGAVTLYVEAAFVAVATGAKLLAETGDVLLTESGDQLLAQQHYAQFDSAIFDTSTFGPELTWTDLTTYVRSVTTRRGFSRGTQSYNAGTCRIVLNNQDGRFSLDNTNSPYYGSGMSTIRTRRPIRVYAEVTLSDSSVVRVPVFSGRIRKWPEVWSLNGLEATVTVECDDAFAELGAFDGYEQTPAGGGETSGKRTHRILDNAGYGGERNIDIGTVTLQPTTLAQNALTEVKLTAASEGGSAWIDANGVFRFDGAYAPVQYPQMNTVQATFADDGLAGAIKYIDLEMPEAGDLVINQAFYARAGGTTQRYTDQLSRSLNGPMADSRTDLVSESDAHVVALAERTVELNKDPERRVESLTFKPYAQGSTDRTDAAWSFLAGGDLRTLIQVDRNPPSGTAFEVSRRGFIASLDHDISWAPVNDWTVTVSADSASVWQSFTESLFDTAVFDTATFTF